MSGARPPAFDTLEGRFEEILTCEPVAPDEGEVIGRSREGRAVRAFRAGSGPRRVSLVAGCHADEPVGPRLLRRLAAHLAELPAEDPLLAAAEWWILPHLNPDGEAANAAWQRLEGSAGAGPLGDGPGAYDPALYRRNVVRELPGDDVEFGFPFREEDGGARPENRAAWSWWREAGSFALHASLHGMSVSAGPWYLVEPGWRGRSELERLMERCRASTAHAGYALRDVERAGEKGFHRLAPGFATRPNHVAMREHFLAARAPEAAARFRPSSMETIRALGGDPLTLVPEMPLFLGDARDADPADLRPVPVADQMRLQWAFVCAGLEAVTG
jgi:hypothetical protein